MSASSRPGVLALTLLAGLCLAGAAFASPSASLEQVRNGLASSPTTPIPTWVSGNAGASNSHYLESHSIAYRTVMDGLPTDGTVVEIVIGYDAKVSGSYAIDYLTQYQRLLPHVTFAHRDPEVFNPLDGVTGVAPGVSTAPIPVVTQSIVVDPDGAGSDPAAAQPTTSMASLPDSERVMTLFGGTILDVSYVTQADVALATKSSSSQVKVRFVPAGPKAVLAWGGHIACRWDWGFNADGTPRSAGGISGSSYHMRLVGWNLGSLGNQDRSMSTDAVFPVPHCAISNQGPFCAGSTNTHTAPVGMETYQWSLFDNTCGAVIVGSDTSTSVTVQTNGAGQYGILLTTGASGFTKQCQAVVQVNAAPTANAGADIAVCANLPQVQLAGNVTGGNAAWSGGAGSYVPGPTDPNAVYTPTAAEIAAGGVTLTLTCTPLAGPCPAASAQVRITIRPIATANAGADQVVCAGNPLVTLAGTVGGSATGGTWSGGLGTFTPSATALHATYLPTAAEIAAGGVTLTLTSDDPAGPCGPASDAMHVAINPSAVADAGADQVVCASAPLVQLAGVVSGGASGGTWSGGTGTFTPNASTLAATYLPSAAEIAAGGVTLTLTTNDPAGPCGAASDQVRITINPAAVANAGADVVVCATNPLVQLVGIVAGGASSGTWSGGLGTFTPNAFTLNATYLPTPGEIAAGGVTLTLTSDDPAGPCGAASDQVHVTINPAATANAGADQIVCASSPLVQLAGSVGGGATGGTWSGGAGTFKPSASALNATYLPTATEIAAGGVTLTLTTNDPAGPCGPVADAMHVTIDPITIVNAGPDQVVCGSAATVQLAGSVSGTVTTGAWTGGTGTFNPGRTALNAQYTPSAAEIAAGSVTLVLTSAASGRPCPPASDAMTIFINAPVTVNAGPDQIVCATSPVVQLAGAVGNGATGGTWSGGAGSFSPNANALNALYTPTAGEIAAGSVTLTLTTNDPAGPCPPVSDQVKITFDKITVTVPTRTVCSGVVPVTLCANASNGVAPYTYKWSNGATTQCISVSDTAVYQVTVTDAKGCVATGAGSFHARDCVGELTHTTTTCDSYQSGNADDFGPNDVTYQVNNNVISTIAPGVFFYWTKFEAPSANFTVQLVQTRDNDQMPFIPIQQGNQVQLYDANCNTLGSGIETSPGQGSVQVTGAVPGQVFLVSVKYSLKALVGSYLDPSRGVHYSFLTIINGKTVDMDPDGLQIGVYHYVGVGPGGGDDGSLTLYRPTPNPFTSSTRMAYTVPRGVQSVGVGVYDVAGRLVRSLANGDQAAGRYVVLWDGRDSAGATVRRGVYFVHVRVGAEIHQVKVLYVR